MSDPVSVLGLDRTAPWMAPDAPTALCGEVDPDLWFPEKGGSTADSKRLCRMWDCQVSGVTGRVLSNWWCWVSGGLRR